MRQEALEKAVKRLGEEADMLFAEGITAHEVTAALFCVGVSKVRRVVQREAVRETVNEMVAGALKATDPNNRN